MKPLIAKFQEIKDKLVSPEKSYDEFDKAIFNSLIERGEALIIKHFGKDSSYIQRLSQFKKDSWYSVKKTELEQVKTLIDIIIDDIELEERKEVIVEKPILVEQTNIRIANEINTLNNKVFIVHGHNETMKQAVARIVEKLELNPIILHEQSNQGNTVIEKFMTHSNVGFAIILLSADDMGYAIKDGNTSIRKRARQNVILELGFFIGKLGRNRVVALVEDADRFEIPSDINGVIYIPFDKNEKWKFDILKELVANGYNLDANRIL